MTLAFVAMRHFGPFLGCDEPPLSWKNAGIGSFAKERLDYMPDVDETHLELKVCQGWEPITRELASDWLRTASYVGRFLISGPKSCYSGGERRCKAATAYRLLLAAAPLRSSVGAHLAGTDAAPDMIA
jgi:hypothetical protein